MRLQPQQFAQHLEKPLQPLYLLVGDEPLAQRESLDALRAAAKRQGIDERVTLIAERSFNWQQLGMVSQSISLFASRRLIELSIPSGRPGTDGGKALQALAQQASADTIFVVILPKLDRDGRNSAWYAALEQAAIVVTMQEVDAQRLPQWIAQRLSQQGQQADDDTLHFIANQVEGNLLAAHQEIQKLGLLYPAGALSADNVREAVLNVSRYDPFQLGDAMLRGDPERTARILQGLQAEGAEPVPVGKLLTDWTIRPLLKLKQAQSQGEALATALQKSAIRRDKHDIFRRAAERLNLRQLQAALLKLAEIDKTAKGLITGDAWLEISRLCFGLSRVGKKPRAH